VSKSTGTRYERDLIHAAFDEGLTAIRAAGSGSQQAPAPDVIILADNTILCVEAKFKDSERAYLNEKEAKALRYFVDRTDGALSYVAFRRKRHVWKFQRLPEAPRTKSGNVKLVHDRMPLTLKELFERHTEEVRSP